MMESLQFTILNITPFLAKRQHKFVIGIIYMKLNMNLVWMG